MIGEAAGEIVEFDGYGGCGCLRLGLARGPNETKSTKMLNIRKCPYVNLCYL